MVLLLLFAVLAGAGTALSPCVLPVLPAVLSAGAAGGRRRPLGVVAGLAATYTLAVVALASVVQGVGVAGEAARALAIAVLLAAGIALLLPAVGARVETALAPLARLAPRRSSTDDGFTGGLLLGGALGFVYAPCAGPILAAVVSVSATRGASVSLLFVALAYAAGTSLVLLALALGSRRIAERVRRAGRGPTLQRTLGAVLALTAVAMLTGLDLRFTQALAEHAPTALINPTRSLERSSSVARELTSLRGPSRFAETPAQAQLAAARPGFLPLLRPRPAPAGALRGVRTPSLPRIGAAPQFAQTGRWFNSPPLSMIGLHGRVVLVDFWTYTCINCLRTLPFVRALDDRYRSAGLTIVGVHTPEFAFEHSASNVRSAIGREGLHYPVVQDNDYGTWSAWGNQYWPATYLVDAQGQVRRAHFGEGGYQEEEAAIRALLVGAGAKRLPPPVTARAEEPAAQVATPETYLGADRARGWLVAPRVRTRDYRAPRHGLPLATFALGGVWTVTGESATPAAPTASIRGTIQAAKAYLVMSSAGGRRRTVTVLLDGRPYRQVRVGAQKLYELVSLPRAERHDLELALPHGVSGYAFTFG